MYITYRNDYYKKDANGVDLERKDYPGRLEELYKDMMSYLLSPNVRSSLANQKVKANFTLVKVQVSHVQMTVNKVKDLEIVANKLAQRPEILAVEYLDK